MTIAITIAVTIVIVIVMVMAIEIAIAFAIRYGLVPYSWIVGDNKFYISTEHFVDLFVRNPAFEGIILCPQLCV